MRIDSFGTELFMIGSQAFSFQICFSFDLNGKHIVSIINKKINFSTTPIISLVIGFNAL
jgi:predicted nucleotide-binding protein (sugar kinase/HSP70/actin superfamily)